EVALGLIELGMVGEVKSLRADVYRALGMGSEPPLFRQGGVAIEDASFAESVAAQVASGVAGRDISEAVAPQDQGRRIRIADGLAEYGEVDDVGPVARPTVHITEARSVGADIQRQRCSTFGQHGTGHLPAAAQPPAQTPGRGGPG